VNPKMIMALIALASFSLGAVVTYSHMMLILDERIDRVQERVLIVELRVTGSSGESIEIESLIIGPEVVE